MSDTVRRFRVSDNIYVGIDAAGNKHIHVRGKCYTNDELDDEIQRLTVENAALHAQHKLDEDVANALLVENGRYKQWFDDHAAVLASHNIGGFSFVSEGREEK